MTQNPIREYRLSQRLELGTFARRAGVSALAVTRTEQGVFTHVPPTIEHYLLTQAGDFVTAEGFALTDPDSLQEAYRNFQTITRRDNYGCLTESLPPYTQFASPLVQWRLLSGIESQIGFCKLFCVHPSPYALAESGRQVKLPTQLVDALAEAGYDDNTLHELARRQVQYATKRNRV